ncbi:MAG: hypothetical protein ACR2MX_08965, partial [Cyclobacteriaceae bacterium]
MKTIVKLICLLAIFSCSEEDPGPMQMGSDASLIGSWLFGTAGAQESSVLTFVDATNYMIVDDGIADDGGQPGIEKGTYSFDANSGELTVNATTDTNGDWGLSDDGQTFPITVNISGSTMNFTNDGDAGQLSKIDLSQSSSLIGSWLLQDSDQFTVVTFIDATNFMLGTAADGGSGLERGTYSLDAGSGAFAAAVVTDTNGDLGLNPDSNS